MAIDLAQDLARLGPPVSVILERSRQQTAQDASFFKKLVYFFELQVPQETVGPVGSTSFLFPLMPVVSLPSSRATSSKSRLQSR